MVKCVSKTLHSYRYEKRETQGADGASEYTSNALASPSTNLRTQNTTGQKTEQANVPPRFFGLRIRQALPQ